MKVKKKKSEVAQSCPTLCDPMDTRLLRPWDFLGKSTGVGCHFLLHDTNELIYKSETDSQTQKTNLPKGKGGEGKK